MFRVALAWICFWIGDALSRPLHWGGNTWVNCALVAVFWRPYQKCMQWSDELQGDNPAGPWEIINNGDEE